MTKSLYSNLEQITQKGIEHPKIKTSGHIDLSVNNQISIERIEEKSTSRAGIKETTEKSGREDKQNLGELGATQNDTNPKNVISQIPPEIQGKPGIEQCSQNKMLEQKYPLKDIPVLDEEKMDSSGKCYNFHCTGMFYWQPPVAFENVLLV